jgi:hypothetical protein
LNKNLKYSSILHTLESFCKFVPTSLRKKFMFSKVRNNFIFLLKDMWPIVAHFHCTYVMNHHFQP